MAGRPCIRVVGARQHNLKGVCVDVPRARLTVITGPSGSGKSSLAFDTIFAEGQRRYVESLSNYARQFLEQLQKPDVEHIEGLPPTLAIDQRTTLAGPRSTVATSTEIHDFLRVLFARVGQPRCWKCDRPIERQTTAQIVDAILTGPEGQRIMLLAPIVQQRRGAHKAVLQRAVKDGYVRARIDGEVTLLEQTDELAAARKHTIELVVDRLTVKPQIAHRLAESVEAATRLSDGRVIVAAETTPGQWKDQPYCAALGCPVHPDVRIDLLTPQLFSFNSPHGACATCAGLGTMPEFDPELIVPDPDRSLGDGAIAAWRGQGQRLTPIYTKLVQEFCERFGVRSDIPFRNIPAPMNKVLMEGTDEEDEAQYGASFEGVLPNLKRRWETTESESSKQRLHAFLSDAPCTDCHGTRLRQEARCVKIDGRSLSDFTAMTISSAQAAIDGLTFSDEGAAIAEPLLREICHRLKFLIEVGVDYLTLDRPSATLSGGEWQRIRLATQIGSGLAGVCYVLDEPTIGLHASDTRRLTAILQRLADMDNTVIVVEHDEEIIAGAAHVIDVGPGAGDAGGHIVAQGSLEEILECEESLTARFLTGRSQLPLPQQRRGADWKHALELRGVTANNLKNVNARFPLGCFIAVTGVSGSGKSTLITQVLLRALRRKLDRTGPKPGPYERIVGSAHVDRVIEVDQSPIGRTPRSNPATYVGVFDLIRKLYAKTREAKIRGYAPARFSFNVKGGRCDACEGQGVKRIAMHFLPDVFVSCAECAGTRYNRETLDVRYRGKSIADVLNMRIDRATEFFDNFANIRQRIQALKDVGLGYMTLGQSSNTLSGGEAQRVKLAAELHRAPTGHTLYVFDEPTTGLHYADIRNLLMMLNRLTDRGHTVIVVEHNLDVIKAADWIVDLGPEGGEDGGDLVVEGTPEQVAACRQSYTGRFLKERLAKNARFPR